MILRLSPAAACARAANEPQAARGQVPAAPRPKRRACVEAERASFCAEGALACRRSAHARASSRFAAAASADTFSVPPPPPMVASTPEERKRLWMAAIKPPIYSVSVVPTMARRGWPQHVHRASRSLRHGRPCDPPPLPGGEAQTASTTLAPVGAACR